MSFYFKYLTQGSKLMYISHGDTQITSSVDYNKWLKRFDTQLNKPTNQYSMKIPNVLKLIKKKVFTKLLGLK